MNTLKVLLATKAVENMGTQLIDLDFDYEEKKIIQKLLLALVMTLNTTESSVIPVKRIYEITDDILDQLERAQAVEGVKDIQNK